MSLWTRYVSRICRSAAPDVSIQPGGLTVITGKSYGATNFIATHKRGTVLFEKAIEVAGPRDRTLALYNGAEVRPIAARPIVRAG